MFRPGRTRRLALVSAVAALVAFLPRTPASAQTVGAPFQIDNPTTASIDGMSTCFGSNVFLVMWEAGGVSGARNIVGRMYDLTGAPVTAQFPICDNCGTPSGTMPQAAFDGTNFLIVWRDARDSSLFGFTGTEGFNIYGQFLDPSPTGGPVGPNFPITNWDGGTLVDQGGAWIAFDGTNYLVVFEEEDGFGNFGISATRVDTNAASPTIIDSASPIVIRSPIVNADALDPFVSWNGSAGLYLVTWDNDADTGLSTEWEVQGRTVDGSSTSLGTIVNFTSVAGSTQRFAGSAPDPSTGRWGIMWSDNRNDLSAPYDSFEIWGQVLDPDGVTLLGSNTLVTSDDTWDRSAAAAGDIFGVGLVVWADGGSGGPRNLKGRRAKLGATGFSFVGNTMTIAPTRPQISTQHVSFGTDGSTSIFLTAWWDSSENILWGQMVLPSLDVALISPNTGVPAGGDTISVYGQGLTQTASMTIDGNALTGVFVPPGGNYLDGTTPAGSLGTWDVIVNSGDGQSLTLTNGFTYTSDKVFNGSMGSGSWNDPGNWTPAGVPISTDSVFFPAGVPNPALFDVASAQVVNVTIDTGASLEIAASPRTLSVSGNWTNDGTLISMPSGTVDFNGVGTQVVNGVTMFPTVTITGGGTVNIATGGVLFAPFYTQLSCCTMTVSGGGELAIQTGTISGDAQIASGGTIEFFTNLTVDNTGTLSLSPGSYLLGDNTASMFVTGLFAANGATVTSTTPGTKRYTLTLDGAIDVTGTTFESPEANGLVISSAATITNFSGNSFTNAVNGGTHLRVEQVGPFSMTAPGCDFDSSFGLGVGSNVTAEDFSLPANVTVAFPSATGAGAGDAYDNEIGGAVVTWNPPPQVWYLEPEFCTTSGGITAIIFGDEFDPSATVTFDGVPASVLAASSGEIMVTVPSGSAGPATVVVSNPDGQSASASSAAFWYSTPQTVQVSAPAGSTVYDYRMYSVPALMTQQELYEALVSQLGPYDETVWRLFRYGDGGYSEFPYALDKPDESITGSSIWLLTRDGVTFSFSGLTSSVASVIPIDLDPGWNQIGNPFTFSVPWSSVMVVDYDPYTHEMIGSPESTSTSSLIGDTLYLYEGSSGYVSASSLVPGEGYWVYNAAGHSIELQVPGPGGAKPSPAGRLSGLRVATPPPPPPPGGAVTTSAGSSGSSASLPGGTATGSGGTTSYSSGGSSTGSSSGGGGGGGGGCFVSGSSREFANPLLAAAVMFLLLVSLRSRR